MSSDKEAKPETTSEDTVVESEPKKQKTMLPEAPDDQWPECWVMTDECKDQKAPNKREPNVPVSVELLRNLGIRYVNLS